MKSKKSLSQFNVNSHMKISPNTTFESFDLNGLSSFQSISLTQRKYSNDNKNKQDQTPKQIYSSFNNSTLTKNNKLGLRLNQRPDDSNIAISNFSKSLQQYKLIKDSLHTVNRSALKQDSTLSFSALLTQKEKGTKKFFVDKIDNNKYQTLFSERTQRDFSNQNTLTKILSENNQVEQQVEQLKKISTDDKFNQILSNLMNHIDYLQKKFEEKSTIFPDDELQNYMTILEIKKFTCNLVKNIEINQNIQFQTLKVKYDELQRQFNELQQIKELNEQNVKHRIKEVKQQARDQVLTIQKQENILQIEKCKLVASNKELTEQVINQQNDFIVNNLNQEISKLKTDNYQAGVKSQKATYKLESKINKQEFVINQLKYTATQLENEKNNFQIQVKNQQEKINLLEEQLQQTIEKKRFFRENFQMSSEDLRMYEVKYRNIMEVVFQLKEKLISTSQKLNLFTQTQEGVIETIVNYDNDIQTMKEVVIIYQQQSGVNQNQFKKQITVQESNNNSDENSQIENTLKHLTIKKKKFVNFILPIYTKMEKEQQAKLNQIKDLNSSLPTGTNPFGKSSFLPTIRAIFDSKFNEFIYETDARLYTNFPEFVCSWLEQFQVCDRTRKVKLQEVNDVEELDTLKAQFFLDLNNSLVARHWEALTFREFLAEIYCNEELYFYLQCRFMLFKGNQLYQQSGTFSLIQYVRYDKIEALLDIILFKFDKESIIKIKKRLKIRAKIKKEVVVIDTGFVLRVLLQFYRQERYERYKLIKNGFQLISANKNDYGDLSFSSFRDFIEIHFSFANNIEIATLYRESASLGKGTVNADSFFVAGTELNFFIRCIKIRTLFDKQSMHNQNIGVIQKYQNNSFLETVNHIIIEQMVKYNNQVKQMKKISKQMGLEKVYQQIIQFERHLKNNLQTETQDLNGLNFCYITQRFIALIFALRNAYVFTLSLTNNVNQENIIQTDFELLSNSMHSLDNIFKIQSHFEEEKQKAIVKLQKFVRIRFNKWYRLLGYILEMNKLYKNQENT